MGDNCVIELTSSGKIIFSKSWVILSFYIKYKKYNFTSLGHIWIQLIRVKSMDLRNNY